VKKMMISASVVTTMAFSGGDIAPVEPVVSTPEEVHSWEYAGQIYLWGASINGTTGTGIPLSIKFEDLFKNLRMAGMAVIGARKDKLTLLADLIYMDVNKKDLNVPVGPGPIISLNSIGMKAWIIQPAVSYAVYETDVDRFELLAGARYMSLELPVGFTNPIGKVSASDDALNGIVGVRGTHNFTDKWVGNYHLDVGTGDSDSTWQGVVGLGYKFDTYSLHAGYRYLTWDHGGEAVDDLTLDGVYAGVRFIF
jgi:hypothetical protein